MGPPRRGRMNPNRDHKAEKSDSDFVLLLERFGAPPQILWVTCGNTSNARLRDVLRKSFPEARARLEQGEPLVEISDAH